jgi:hypothetical protein
MMSAGLEFFWYRQSCATSPHLYFVNCDNHFSSLHWVVIDEFLLNEGAQMGHFVFFITTSMHIVLYFLYQKQQRVGSSEKMIILSASVLNLPHCGVLRTTIIHNMGTSFKNCYDVSLNPFLLIISWNIPELGMCWLTRPFSFCFAQESVKSKHPQLLY